MYFPKLTAPAQRRVTVDRFLGLDRRAGSAMGCFQNMENLWSGGYPALETRPARGEAAVLSKPNGLTCRDALVWVDGTALYVGGEKTGLALSDGEKQLVNMGAYLLIWPDRKYINTQDLSDFGSMENRNVTAGEVTTALCRSGGEELGDYAAGAAAPDAPEAGTLWLDTSDAEPVMKRYDGSAWLDVENVCTKISAAGIGRGFAAGDGVTVEGCEAQTLNGLHVLDAAGDDWIAVPAATATVGSQTAEVTAARRVPDMDFVVEQGNRLWGCKYGIVDGRPVNEIYASKLGDFRNWNSFAGLSTDSYAASRGSDGAFTGAAACLGGVIFFKEDCMERVYPSATGAHQIVTLRCPGVKKGCHGAAAVVDGTLFYLGLGGVYAFDGSMPGCVSMPLGSVRYQDGAAAGWNGQYWLAARDGDGKRHLLVYDTARGLWHRQDDADIMAFTVCDGALYGLARDGRLLDMTGGSGQQETALRWMAETGELGLSQPENKYLARLELRVQPEDRARLEASASYDGGRSWETLGQVIGGDGQTRGYLLHLRPRRCRQVRLRLQGTAGAACSACRRCMRKEVTAREYHPYARVSRRQRTAAGDAAVLVSVPDGPAAESGAGAAGAGHRRVLRRKGDGAAVPEAAEPHCRWGGAAEAGRGGVGGASGDGIRGGGQL